MTELTVNQVDIAKLQVNPGEMLVVTTKVPLTRDGHERVKEAFTKAFEKGGGYVPPILVIDDKLELRIMTASDLTASGGKG